MRAWHLFTGWYEATRARADDPQEELPFSFVELSETFAKIAQERGFFVTGFDSEFFHRLGPVEQRLALYLSKMFVSQEVHRRHEAELYHALPIRGIEVDQMPPDVASCSSGTRGQGLPEPRRVLVRQSGSARWDGGGISPTAQSTAGSAVGGRCVGSTAG